MRLRSALTHLLWWVLFSSLYMLMMVLPLATAGAQFSAWNLLMVGCAAAVMGAVSYGLWRTYGRLARTLGKWTALVALAAGVAVAGTGIAITLPTCPGSAAGACTTAEAATWGMSSSLMLVLIAFVAFATAAGRRLVMKGVGMLSERRQDDDGEVEAAPTVQDDPVKAPRKKVRRAR